MEEIKETLLKCPHCELLWRDLPYRVEGGILQGLNICESCYSDNYFTCDQCQCVLPESYYHADGVCGSCYDSESEEAEEAEELNDVELNNLSHCSKDSGLVITSPRHFGVELETLAPSNDALREYYKVSPKGFGTVSDGSISGEGVGVEIVSTILQGKAGENAIMDTCAEVNKLGFSVNDSCGFHLHLDAEGYRHYEKDSTKHLKNLLSFYDSFDCVFRAMVHQRRRTTRYAYGVPSDVITKAEKARLYSSIERAWYATPTKSDTESRKRGGKYDNTRYHAMNLHPLFSKSKEGEALKGTIEFRLHSGTLNIEKILMWVSIHQKMLDTFTQKTFSQQTKRFVHKSDAISHRVACMVKILNLSKEEEAYIQGRITKFANKN